LADWWAKLLELAQGDWSKWATDGRMAFVLAALVFGLLALWLIGWQHKRQRTQAMLLAVNDATFGRTIQRSRTGAWGFAVSVEPPPEYFREFNISYQPVSILVPSDLIRICFGGRRTTLQFAGLLVDAPNAEIIWLRGKPPARVLGTKPGRAPWVQSRLDFAGAEFATRGTNVGAVKHVFHDMYARFTPALKSVSVQRERRPQLRMVVQGRIDPRDLSPLITAVRALGRAAMRE
jgi:hypothetical protein